MCILTTHSKIVFNFCNIMHKKSRKIFGVSLKILHYFRKGLNNYSISVKMYIAKEAELCQ